MSDGRPGTRPQETRVRTWPGAVISEKEIRPIFGLFVLAMWVVAGFLIADDRWTGTSWVMLTCAAVCCAIVFRNFVLVFNYGYSTSLILLNLVVLVAYGAPLGALLVGGVIILYGVRLWLFTFRRYRAETWADRKAGLKIAHQQLPGPVKVILYLQTTTLMTFHAMVTYNVATKADRDGDDNLTAWVVAGVVVMLVGLVLEAVADEQKQKAKAAAPHRWVSTGTYARTRHPNYLGEILFQLGLIVAGLGSGVAWFGVAAGILAPLYIVVLMVSATTGGETSKEKRHADDPEYQAYKAHTGALLPRLRG